MRMFLILLMLAFPVSVYAVEIGDDAPDFKALSLEGKQISYFKDMKGKRPVYLIFWATW